MNQGPAPDAAPVLTAGRGDGGEEGGNGADLVADLDGGRIGRWYWSVRNLCWPLRNIWLKVELEHAANVPATGPVILAPNHRSFLDSVLLMHTLPREVTFLGKAEYLDHWATRTLFPAAGMIPVDRSGKQITRSLGEAVRRLQEGHAVGLFPEGTRSRDGRLHRGHTGVAHLALRTGAPIVPVGIIGSEAAQPVGSRLPRPGVTVTLRFGSPIDLGRWADRGTGRDVKREITDEVMEAIAALSGQTMAGDTDLPSPDTNRASEGAAPAI